MLLSLFREQRRSEHGIDAGSAALFDHEIVVEQGADGFDTIGSAIPFHSHAICDTVRKQVSVGSGSGFYEADEYDIRKMETRVMVPSGNTLVLGGLVQDDVRSGNTKVPILGDIPVVGYLFRVDTKSRQKSNLLVFLTPTIVEDEDFQPTKSDFLKTPVPPSDSVEGPWSSWDSGKPRDWSNIDMEAYQNAKFDDSVMQPATAPSTPAAANP